jgi:hypothetical protein
MTLFAYSANLAITHTLESMWVDLSLVLLEVVAAPGLCFG